MLFPKGLESQKMELFTRITNMTNKELSIGSILNQQGLGQIIVEKIFQDHIYAHLPDGKPLGMLMLDEVEPIEISEKYLLDFGFTKGRGNF